MCGADDADAAGFTHLHVASCHSLRYGASTPQALVARAQAHGQTALALTDRVSVSGAVQFLHACQAAGLASIIGAIIPVRAAPGDPPAARARDPRHPWVLVLAHDARSWSGLCRLISAAHAGSAHAGGPATGPDDVALPESSILEYAVDSTLTVLLGPWSPVGRALCARDYEGALMRARSWVAALGPDHVHLEIVSHRAPTGSPVATATAAHLLTLAQRLRCRAVLTNAVRFATVAEAPIVDVLDAVRRLIPLDAGHVDRPNAQGHLAGTAQMRRVCVEVAEAAGLSRYASHMWGWTQEVASAHHLTAAAVGMGRVYVPESEVVCGSGPLHADDVLRRRAESGLAHRGHAHREQYRSRLHDELSVISRLGLATYFLTVAQVCDLVRARGIRVAARGSGAGCLVNHVLGISGVDPVAHGLLMERFLSPLRTGLPDIDIDVESARRLEVYDAIVERFGRHRVCTVMMRDTYRVRHAIRDVGAALGLPAGEIDALAKAFPHIRARDARAALAALPELRDSTWGRLFAAGRLTGVLQLVEALDGLPRHLAMHPCGVIISDAGLRDRVPVQPSAAGYPMAQFDKDDVEALGLLKLDVLGVRMQSAMAHAISQIADDAVDIDALPLDDPATYALIRSSRTLGCFQIESPGQRELVGRLAPRIFHDLIIDISLFRPGPVTSDMITPFLASRHGWQVADLIHPDLHDILCQTEGVVVFHEQVIALIARMTGCSLAHADEQRRALGPPVGRAVVAEWFRERARERGYPDDVIERVWRVLDAFASFGFCKAHAAAFALPTYQSAWLKTHHPAAFYAGVLTHDPGMYPKRLILDDARQQGVAVLGLDVNRSVADYIVEPTADGRPGIRLALSEVKGISAVEVGRIVTARAEDPYRGLADFWSRTHVSRATAERLIRVGGLDSACPGSDHRDLLLDLADLAGVASSRRARPLAGQLALTLPASHPPPADPGGTSTESPSEARRRSRAGLPLLTDADRVRAEIEVLGLDVSRHLVDFYSGMLLDIRATRSRDLLTCRTRTEILVGGVKVAIQAPPVRSGQRVVFLTLDDATGPVDLAFFDDVQQHCATVLFGEWLLLARGVVRRSGGSGVSLRATGCWSLSALHGIWRRHGRDAVWQALRATGVSGRHGSPPTPASRLWHGARGASGSGR
ncbi:MAG: DNA polymerase III subunit alpha [Actinomycetales bacterium]|nr:DNA polymerase III subunit alpha [Actinomycetales bacterium]